MKSELDIALEALDRIESGSYYPYDFLLVRQALEYSRDAFKWLYVFNAVVPNTKGLELLPILGAEDVQEIDEQANTPSRGYHLPDASEAAHGERGSLPWLPVRRSGSRP